MKSTECPNCEESEETVAYDESEKKDLWFCERCGAFYEVFYKEDGTIFKVNVCD